MFALLLDDPLMLLHLHLLLHSFRASGAAAVVLSLCLSLVRVSVFPCMDGERERGVSLCSSLAVSLSLSLALQLEHIIWVMCSMFCRVCFFQNGGGGLEGGWGVHLFSFPEFQVSGLIWKETLELVAKKKKKIGAIM